MTIGEVPSTLRETAKDAPDVRVGRSFSPDSRVDIKGEPSAIRGRLFDPDKRIDAGEIADGQGEAAFNPDNRIGLESGDLDDRKVERDDAGNPYKIDGRMMPNCRYEINGYTYKTDELGRRVSAEGTLHIKQHEGRLPIKVSKEQVGGKEHRESDDKGHMVGDQFGGSSGVENLVSMDRDINQKDFNKLENYLAKAVKAGSEVNYKFEAKYNDDSQRPSKFVVTYTIDGEKSVRVFINEPGGAK